MDALTFITQIVDAIAWPATVLVAIWILRRPLVALIPFTRSIQYKDLQIEFGRAVGELRKTAEAELSATPIASGPPPSAEERLVLLCDVSPNAAILEAWREVERSSLALLGTEGIEVDPGIPTPYKTIQRHLDASDRIEQRKVKIFSDLRRLRNKIAHAEGAEATRDQALEYIEVALALKRYLQELTE